MRLAVKSEKPFNNYMVGLLVLVELLLDLAEFLYILKFSIGNLGFEVLDLFQ